MKCSGLGMGNMRKYIVIIVSFFILICHLNFGQVADDNIWRKVLKTQIVGKEFVFGKWTKGGNTETHLKYLGGVKTKSGYTYKIVTSAWIWGHAHRATSRVLVFDGNNKYIGDYHLNMIYDLPNKLENGNLIFNNSGPDCDAKISTVIDFKNGLPKEFFRKCKGDDGDIYTFAKNR
jgi:hypothetical protein